MLPRLDIVVRPLWWRRELTSDEAGDIVRELVATMRLFELRLSPDHLEVVVYVGRGDRNLPDLQEKMFNEVTKIVEDVHAKYEQKRTLSRHADEEKYD